MGVTSGNEESETRGLNPPGTTPPPTPPTGGPPPIAGGPPPMPTNSPFGPPVAPTLDLGLRGRARWEALVNANRNIFTSGVGGQEFNQWVLSLKDDLSDPEFSNILAWVKRKAQEVEDRRKNSSHPRTVGKSYFEDDKGVPLYDQALFPQPGTMPTPGNAPSIGNVGPMSMDELKEEKKVKLQSQKNLRATRFESQTAFKGAPTKLETLTQPEPPTQEVLDQWARNNNRVYSGAQADYFATSGEYVYVGTETDPSTGAQRPVYMYRADARGGLKAMGPAAIKSYQAKLGHPVTGIPEAELQNLWDNAVEEARGYAAAGIRMSVQEIFDSWVKARQDALARRGGGGGGGGGNGALEDDPEDMAAVDYYRAMMAVLGDISGVQG